MSSGRALAAGAPFIGVMVMDAPILRPPGDVGNPASFPFPVRCRVVPRASLARLIAERDRGILELFKPAGWALVREGAAALTTTCGFMILFQKELAAEFPVPVLSSSLLLLPLIQAMLRPDQKVGIITADATNLDEDHLRMAGGDPRRVAVIGLQDRPHFAAAIFGPELVLDQAEIGREVREAAGELGAREPGLGAVLLECANLPPYAHLVQQTLGVPVFDFYTMLTQLNQALTRVAFPPGPAVGRGAGRNTS